MLGQCIIQTEAYSSLLGFDLSFRSAACPSSISLKVHSKRIIHNQYGPETANGPEKIGFKHTLHKTREETYITCLTDN